MEVKMRGKSIKLSGEPPKIGELAPDCELVTKEMKKVHLSDFRPAIYSCVPSLDTSTCSTQTKRFHQEVEKEKIPLVTISMDLPFAQQRFCGAEHLESATFLSDHREATFGMAYGILIPSIRILTRAVFVVDKEGILRHCQVVEEITEEPDYESALVAMRIAMRAACT